LLLSFFLFFERKSLLLLLLLLLEVVFILFFLDNIEVVLIFRIVFNANIFSFLIVFSIDLSVVLVLSSSGLILSLARCLVVFFLKLEEVSTFSRDILIKVFVLHLRVEI